MLNIIKLYRLILNYSFKYTIISEKYSKNIYFIHSYFLFN